MKFTNTYSVKKEVGLQMGSDMRWRILERVREQKVGYKAIEQIANLQVANYINIIYPWIHKIKQEIIR